MPTPQQIQQAKYKSYLQQYTALVQGEQKSAQQFDKAILTLAASALAASIIFIEKIAPHPTKETIRFLIIAWSGFAASLLSILCSFLSSQHAFRRQRDVIDDEFLGKTPRTNPLMGLTITLNFLSMIAFFVGAIGLAWFTFSNIQKFGGNDDREQHTAATKTVTTTKTKAVTTDNTPPSRPAKPRSP